MLSQNDCIFRRCFCHSLKRRFCQLFPLERKASKSSSTPRNELEFFSCVFFIACRVSQCECSTSEARLSWRALWLLLNRLKHKSFNIFIKRIFFSSLIRVCLCFSFAISFQKFFHHLPRSLMSLIVSAFSFLFPFAAICTDRKKRRGKSKRRQKRSFCGFHRRC